MTANNTVNVTKNVNPTLQATLSLGQTNNASVELMANVAKTTAINTNNFESILVDN